MDSWRCPAPFCALPDRVGGRHCDGRPDPGPCPVLSDEQGVHAPVRGPCKGPCTAVYGQRGRAEPVVAGLRQSLRPVLRKHTNGL